MPYKMPNLHAIGIAFVREGAGLATAVVPQFSLKSIEIYSGSMIKKNVGHNREW